MVMSKAHLKAGHDRQVTKEEYQSVGSMALGERLAERLRAAGKRPYLIPVGGSNGLGTWGYVEAMREISEQAGEQPFTDIALVRSGASAAGSVSGVKIRQRC